jgi:hypothetical protein
MRSSSSFFLEDLRLAFGRENAQLSLSRLLPPLHGLPTESLHDE